MTSGSQCVAMLEYDAIVTLPMRSPFVSAASEAVFGVVAIAFAIGFTLFVNRLTNAVA